MQKEVNYMFAGPPPNWENIAAIVTILATLFAGASWLFNKVISTNMLPLTNKIEHLIESLDKLNTTFNKQQAKIERIDERLDEHDKELERHDVQISNVSNEVFNRKDKRQ